MKIYLDNCALQRPLDDKTQIRIALEAEAIVGVFSLCESGEVELVFSEVLLFEIGKNPQASRKDLGIELQRYAKVFVKVNPEIETLAEHFTNFGIQPLDALHLASAEFAGADFFCTCDDTFLKKALKLDNLSIKVVSPLKLIEELEQ